MKYCSECGSEVSENAKHCPNCGKELEAESKTEVLEPITEEKIEKNKEVKKEEVIVEKTTTKNKKNSNNTTILILVAIVAIGVAIFFGSKYFTENKNPYIGTWVRTFEYSDNTKSNASLEIKKDNTFVYTYGGVGESSTTTTKGTWEKVADRLVLKYTSGGETSKKNIYLVDNETICFDKLDCDEDDMLIKSTSLKNKTYKVKEKDVTADDYDGYYDDDDDYDDYDYDEDYSYQSDTKGNWSFDMTYDYADRNKVIINVFYGDGCPHCEELFTFLDGLDSKTKSKFVVLKYETWYNEDNAEIMKAISDFREDDASGVPYFIIDGESWLGFDEDYKSEIIDAINDYTGNTRNNYVEWFAE